MKTDTLDPRCKERLILLHEHDLRLKKDSVLKSFTKLTSEYEC